MKGLFKFNATKKPAYQAVTILTNYQACELGLALKSKLLQNNQSPVVLVSPNPQQTDET